MIYFRKPRPVPSDVHQVITTSMLAMKVSICVGVIVSSLRLQPCFAFNMPKELGGWSYRSRSSGVGVTSQSPSESPPEMRLRAEAIQLKYDLVVLAERTRRGFSASRSDRDEAKRIIGNLSMYSPSDEPACAYYREKETSGVDRSTIAGKWTLIYTDAPDITSLDGGPLAMAKLGRIGQECSPPSIKNVIEWQRPDWASSLPFSGGVESRVLQKVCCEGSATQNNPKVVDLKVTGVEILGMNGGDDLVGGDNRSMKTFLNGPAALLERNPVKLQGPLTAPFGKFEILYLDDDMRVTKTFQGFFAVNKRDENPWF